MEQLTLFDNPVTKPIARTTDPVTSQAAAESIQPKLSKLEDRMYRMFEQLGEATAREAAEACMVRCNTGMTDMETHRKRYTGLRDKGFIKATGKRNCRHTERLATTFQVIK